MHARQLLVFDLDDTLYPERSFVLSGFRAASEWLSARYSVFGLYQRASRLFDNGLRRTVFNSALSELGIKDDGSILAALVEVYRSHSPRIALHDDARWALDHFGQRYRLGLLTDGYAKTQRNKVEALGISRRFDPAVYSDDLGRDRWKPSPAPFLKVMESTGRAGPGCVYVADNPLKDFVAANALGWVTVRVRRSDGEYRRAAPGGDCEALHQIDSLRDLAAILDASRASPWLNPIEPPWYGPVRPVVWEGRNREAPPDPHQRPLWDTKPGLAGAEFLRPSNTTLRTGHSHRS
jgi:putative hydrolase of the HAD superfamily